MGHALGFTTQGQVDPANALGPGDHSFTVNVSGAERQYTVHVPRSYDGTPAPLVIMLHGAGGTAKSAMRQTGWTEKSDEAGFLAVFLEGMSRDPSKPPRFASNPQVWNDGSGRSHAARRNIDDVGFTSAVIDDLQARLAVEKRRIYVTGFSNGASMAFRLGVELSARLAAIAPVAGSFWSDTVEAASLRHSLGGRINPSPRPVSLIYLIGAEDPFNPLEGREINKTAKRKQTPIHRGRLSALYSKKPLPSESVLKWAKMLDCPLEPKVVYDKEQVKAISYAPCQENSEVIFYTIGGIGHTWPGGRSRLPEWMVGKTTDKLKANDIIWEFFQKHPKP